MNRWIFTTVIAIALITAAALWKGEAVMMAYLAGKAPQTTLRERMDLLAGGLEVHLPETGAPPYPVVLQFHGCAGVRASFQRQWADVATRNGLAAVIIDSNGPRGYSRQTALDTICKGKVLLGQERAGDVAAAIALVKNDARFDADRMVLAAWSHGAWSVLDFLTMDMKRMRPAGLKGDMASPPALAGVILFYPYCGAGALSRFRPWTQSPPMLALVAGADLMVDGPQCAKFFERRKLKGAPVDYVFYPDAHHVFDDPFLEPDWIHWYNEEYHKDAEARVEAFLKERRP